MNNVQSLNVKAQDSLGLGSGFYVTRVLNDSADDRAVLLFEGEEVDLTEGIELVNGNSLYSRGHRVEVADQRGLTFRLGHNSEFCLAYQEAVHKFTPVFWGEVFKARFDFPVSAAPEGCGKYRTSCFLQCSATVHTMTLSATHDAFYGFAPNTEIWEYDESGNRFSIVTVTGGDKVILGYEDTLPMRQRYQVVEVSAITNSEFEHISSQFMNPNAWR